MRVFSRNPVKCLCWSQLGQWQGASRDVDECKRDVLGRTANAYQSTEFESKHNEGTNHNEHLDK